MNDPLEVLVINLKLDQFARWCVFLSYIQQEVKCLTGIGTLSDNKMNRASNKGVMDVDILRASLVAQRVKRLPAMRETWVQSLRWEDPWRRKWHPTPVLLPGESHGWRILVGYSPQGRKESDTTSLFTFHSHFSFT